MLKLKLQYFGHLMRRVESLEKTLMLGGIGGRRRRRRQTIRWLDGITGSMDMGLSKVRETVKDRVSSYLGRKPPRAPQLEETPETPPSSPAEGLLFLHGLVPMKKCSMWGFWFVFFF